MEVEVDDIRGDLEKAFEQHESTPEIKEGGSPENAPESVRAPEQEAAAKPDADTAPEVGDPGEESSDGRVRGPDGKFQKKLAKHVGQEPVLQKPAVEQSKPADPKPQETGIAPPISWKGPAKAEWAKIPKAAQEEIARRETETSKVLSQTANARKHFDEFNTTIAPFMPLIRAQNSNPMAAVKNLMTTAAGLTIGSPQQKAQIIAEMIGNFGIDIETLDKLLQGQPIGRPQAQGTSQLEVAIQRQLQPVHDFMNKMQQTQAQREAQMRADADRVVEQFAAKNEFFEELREDIADLMEVAANRGREMSLEQAYKIAVSTHPEYSAAVQQRAAAAKAQQNSSNIQKARNAASSVRGNPALGSPDKGGPSSRRDDIAAAWEDLSAN